MKEWTVISMFSGCGGMDLGFIGGFSFLKYDYELNPFKIIWANEINSAACKTYRVNIGIEIIEGDIREKIHSLPKSADVIIGGFPCQDISINGKMLGLGGLRSSLYKYMVEAVEIVRPKVFVAENVGGLLLKKNCDALSKILSDFERTNYNLHYSLYHAEDYGVPQTRERVFIVGTRKDCLEFVPPTPIEISPVTAKEALQDLENMDENKDFSHIWSKALVSGEQLLIVQVIQFALNVMVIFSFITRYRVGFL